MGGGEWKALAKTWWCRGGGAAVVMLLAVVSVFRAPRDAIFWAAVAFFLAHTALTLRRYLVERRHRTTATVIRHHDAPTPIFPAPLPVISLVVPKKPQKMPNLLGK